LPDIIKRRSFQRALLCVFVGAAYTYFIAQTGVPALRHDWSWPNDIHALRSGLVDSASGWASFGFGLPRAYPTDYIIDVVLLIISMVGSPLFTLAALAFAIGIAVAYGAMRLVDVLDRPSPAFLKTIGCVAIAAFNPWSYDEIVAGHILMVLAFAGAMMALSYALEGREDVLMALTLLIVFQQIQYFIVSVVGLSMLLLRRRWVLTIVTICVAFAPVAFGVFEEFHRLSATPYFLTWQNSQSLAPVSALLLSGYFGGYDKALGLLATLGSSALLASVCISLVLSFRRKAVIAALACALVLLCVVTGVNGPLSGVYTAIVERIPASGLFRELFDLVGFLCIAYLVIIAASPPRTWLSATVMVAGVALFLAWLVSPPSRFWVSASTLPVPPVAAMPDTRYALLPAFQPFSFNGRGSGADPDATLRAHGVAPINEYLPSYPVSTALAKAEYFGDTTDLSNLGVTSVSCRPWLKSVGDALRAVGVRGSTSSTSCSTRAIRSAPIVAVAGLPGVEPGVPVLGDGNIALLDATDGFAVAKTLAPGSFNGAKEWIDAQFIERERPYVASAYGGVYTNTKAPYPIAKGEWLLFTGALESNTGREEVSRPGYRWVRFDGNEVTCMDECVIALSGSRTPPPATAIHHRWKPVLWRSITPWLLRVDIARGSAEQLAYREAFDPAWTLIAGGRDTPHVRVDGAFNSWLLPERDRDEVGWMVERVAAVQALLELCSLIWVVYLVSYAIRRKYGQNHG
jgi:hypothetical protein